MMYLKQQLFLNKKRFDSQQLQITKYLKSYTENRDCFENLDDEKFNFWRENQNLQNIGKKYLINIFDKGNLKDVDIPSKITSLQCSLVKRLFDTNFHERKIIHTSFSYWKVFRKKFQISWTPWYSQYLIKKMPEFYREIFVV